MLFANIFVQQNEIFSTTHDTSSSVSNATHTQSGWRCGYVKNSWQLLSIFYHNVRGDNFKVEFWTVPPISMFLKYSLNQWIYWRTGTSTIISVILFKMTYMMSQTTLNIFLSLLLLENTPAHRVNFQLYCRYILRSYSRQNAIFLV